MKLHVYSSNKKIIPVILSGGMGTRLWPMSRKSYPKQFLNLSSNKSLIQETVERVQSKELFEDPIVVSNIEHRFLIAEQLENCGVKSPTIILEPCGRNTAPALALAAHYIKKHHEDALMLVLPSDHIIKDNAAFLDGVRRAQEAAEQGKLVTFGIKPEYAETGYGYIEYGNAINEEQQSYNVANFVEKPDTATAEAYVASGKFAWNSGMFLFPVEQYLNELSALQSEINTVCAKAINTRIEESDFIRLDEKTFAACPSVSVDYAVMEHTKDAATVTLDCGWSDAGSWDSLWRIADKDANGNVIKGKSYNIDSKDCYISCEDGPIVTTVGVTDLAIISTKDSVLVLNKEKAQDIKKLVDTIKQDNTALVESHRRVYRPWGFYDSIDNGTRHQVKRINVKSGAKLSLQMHYHRAEHWIIVRGTARVVCGENEQILTENQSVYIPCGVTHRIENPGKIDLDIIEVQSGTYLGEDDIVRFEDQYGRDADKSKPAAA